MSGSRARLDRLERAALRVTPGEGWEAKARHLLVRLGVRLDVAPDPARLVAVVNGGDTRPEPALVVWVNRIREALRGGPPLDDAEQRNLADLAAWMDLIPRERRARVEEVHERRQAEAEAAAGDADTEATTS